MQERAQRDDVELAPAKEEEQEQAKETEQPVREKPMRFAGGAPPEVAGPAAAQRDRTASQLAYEEDGNTRELKQKVSRHVKLEFGGDYKQAFAHYASQGSDSVDTHELQKLLKAAGVGNGLTRATWAEKIIGKLDSDGDGMIQWNEFEKVVTKTA